MAAVPPALTAVFLGRLWGMEYGPMDCGGDHYQLKPMQKCTAAPLVRLSLRKTASVAFTEDAVIGSESYKTSSGL